MAQTTNTKTEQQRWEQAEAEDIMENLYRTEHESVYDPRSVFCSLCGDDVGTKEVAYEACRSFNKQTSHLCDTCFQYSDSPDNRFVSDKEKRSSRVNKPVHRKVAKVEVVGNRAC